MTHDHDTYHEPQERTVWWKVPSGIAAIFFLLAGGYFLLTEHSAHVVPYLPWLILLLCPLMHMFHHGGHGGHGGPHKNEKSEQDEER